MVVRSYTLYIKNKKPNHPPQTKTKKPTFQPQQWYFEFCFHFKDVVFSNFNLLVEALDHCCWPAIHLCFQLHHLLHLLCLQSKITTRSTALDVLFKMKYVLYDSVWLKYRQNTLKIYVIKLCHKLCHFVFKIRCNSYVYKFLGSIFDPIPRLMGWLAEEVYGKMQKLQFWGGKIGRCWFDCFSRQEMSLGMYASLLLCEYCDVLLPEMFRGFICDLDSFLS